MDVNAYLASKKSEYKNYTIEEIENFYENVFTFEIYKQIINKSLKYRITYYCKNMLNEMYILRFLKKNITDVNLDLILTKKIASTHMKAILYLKNNSLKSKEHFIKYGFLYGWLDPKNYIKHDFYLAGKNTYNKLKVFVAELSINYCKEQICKFAEYYENRKLIWMRLYLLISKEKLSDNDLKRYLDDCLKKEIYK